MSADAFFRMGSMHSVCQDYGVAGEVWIVDRSLPFAVLSDGCSGVVDSKSPGSPFTDWGARLLVLAAMDRLGPISEGAFPTRSLIFQANAWARNLDIPETALDATLLVAVGTTGGGVQVFTTADGVVAWRERSGGIRYESVRFARGMPRYLSYHLDPDRHARLFEDSGEPGDLLAGSFEWMTNVWTPGEGWGPQLLFTEFFTEATPYHRGRYFSWAEGEHRPVDVVALFSDGIESFQDREGRPVPLEMVLVELLSLKSLHGRFVTRRCKKFLEKTCAERGWKHTDDFSMAAVAFEESGAGDRVPGAGQKEAAGEGK